MIPVSEVLIGKKEFEYVSKCLMSGWISSVGRFIEEFEKGWARYCGMKYAISVSSGTTALQIALRCLNLNPGDEVIMPSFTIISCALGCLYNSLKPVLVDVDERTWTMDVKQIEKKISKKTKVIMPVHIYGHPCEMEKIWGLAKKYHLKIVEDAAEAHGGEYKGKKCGSLGDISCFSFYANKIITTGEGGMVLTNNKIYADRVKSLRNLCFDNKRRFYHKDMGYNFRFTTLQSAIGLAQLQRIDELIEKKRRIAGLYKERLKDIHGLTLPVEEEWAKNVYWMYGIVLDRSTKFTASRFAKKLKGLGIETRPFFLGMHEQPVFKRMNLFIGENYPLTEKISRQGLYIPSGLTLTQKEIDKVTGVIYKVINGHAG